MGTNVTITAYVGYAPKTSDGLCVQAVGLLRIDRGDSTDQVHTTNASALKTIYSRRAIKTGFYGGVGSWKGVTSLLGILDYDRASLFRRNLMQCFQSTNLVTLVDRMAYHVMEFCNIVRARARADEDVDGVILTRLLTLDIVADVLWGERMSCLRQISDETPAFVHRFNAYAVYHSTKASIPGMDTFIRCFGSKRWRKLRQDSEDVDIAAKAALERWISAREHRDRDVLSMLMSMGAALHERERLPSSHIPAFLVEMLAAGSATVASKANFAFWELARHPHEAEELRNELRAAFPDVNDIDVSKLVGLPFLGAVIRETLRLLPAIPGPLERRLADPLEFGELKVCSSCRTTTFCW